MEAFLDVIIPCGHYIGYRPRSAMGIAPFRLITSAYSAYNNNTNTFSIYITIPYMKDLCKGFKNVCDKVGIQVPSRDETLSGTFW